MSPVAVELLEDEVLFLLFSLGSLFSAEGSVGGHPIRERQHMDTSNTSAAGFIEQHHHRDIFNRVLTV